MTSQTTPKTSVDVKFWISTALAAVFGLWGAYPYLFPARGRIVYSLSTPTQVASANGPIGITFHGRPLAAQRVSSARLFIWNAGTASVRSQATLAPFEVAALGGSEILRLRAVRVSREVAGILAQGEGGERITNVPIAFRILEPGDGVAYEVLFTHSTDTDRINVRGVFEEAGEVEYAPNEVEVNLRWRYKWPGFVAFVAALVAVFWMTFLPRQSAFSRRLRWSFLGIYLLIVFITFFGGDPISRAVVGAPSIPDSISVEES